MTRKEVFNLMLAFLLGVLLTLLFSSRFRDARYVPFSSNGNQILDTRNGRLYNRATINGRERWHTTVQKVGS